MTTTLLLLGAGAAVFVLGVVAHLVVRDLIRRIVALNVASGGVMLVLLALADRGSAQTGAPDPVPQALVLTGIVVMAAITGLALLLARRIERIADENESESENESENGDGAEGDGTEGASANDSDTENAAANATADEHENQSGGIS